MTNFVAPMRIPFLPSLLGLTVLWWTIAISPLGAEEPLPATTAEQADRYYQQGKALQGERHYAEAIEAFQQALAYDKAHRPEDAAAGLHNIGDCYRDRQQFQQAIPFYEQSLELKKQQLGGESGSYATTLNNLAGVYRKLGQYAEAKARYERALAIWEKVYGPEHGQVAIGLNNLALVYDNLGQYAEAKVRYERALAIALRARQPSLLWTVQGNLRHLYTKQDNPATAIFYGKQAVNTLQMQRGALQQLGVTSRPIPSPPSRPKSGETVLDVPR
ncbi:MAG: tetratricopeptide repeat protein [Gammaproteobacteria bacterium]|nr:tetratricopeptide repeat protein [Gammaproteobacteria bacterium]MBU1655994.1 tetratricopeptide repeat protein [Gammaproteobacteria bacterium]MBU1962202.1 tetratricopeptide repeat protein [Gammaproteobacteria bacterium]